MQKKRNIFGHWGFHVIVWAAILALPFFSIMPGRPIVDGNGYVHYVVMVLSFMAVFYANWFLLIRKYLFSRRVGLYLLSNLLLFLIVLGICHLVFQNILPPQQSMPRWHHRVPHWVLIARFIAGNFTNYLLVAATAVAIKMTQEWYQAEKLRDQAELQHLKSQLNPHFLFNTLNNIYSLIQIDPERAQNAVHDLGQLLRYVLYDSAEATVPVRKEMEFLTGYIALMQIRLPRHVKTDITLPDNPTDRPVAPMLFISLIENAFKHGVDNEKPSFIDISVREEEKRMVCDIRNSNHPKSDGDRSGSGLGLKNLRQRLDLIFPGRYTFNQRIEDDVFVSHLDIPL